MLSMSTFVKLNLLVTQVMVLLNTDNFSNQIICNLAEQELTAFFTVIKLVRNVGLKIDPGVALSEKPLRVDFVDIRLVE